MVEPLIEQLRRAIVEPDPDKTEAISEAILDKGLDPYQSLMDGAVKGLREVGDLFEKGTYFLPELMMAAEAMNKARAILEPLIVEKRKTLPSTGSVMIGTVQGDMHSIGHGIVAVLLKSDGFIVTDIGIDVHIPVWIQKAKELNPDIIGMSALLTVTMPFMGIITKALREADVPAKIIVGGAPVTQGYANEIGVAYGENAVQACVVCRKLMEDRK